MQKWEYKMIHAHSISEKILDNLGRDGWEMCGVAPISGIGTDTLYFKRPMSQEESVATLNVQHVRMEQVTNWQKDNLAKVKPRK